MNDVIFASASALTRRIRARELSAVEVVEMHLARIDAVNPSLNAVVTRCDARALARAKQADVRLAKGQMLGPLHGLPMTIKDAFDTAEVRSTGGTQGRANWLCCINFLPAQHGHPVQVFRKLMHRTVLQRTDFARWQRPSDLS